jgi:hypothetical protein
MGHRDMAKMQRREMDPAGRDTTQAGYVCGIIGTIMCSLATVALILLIGVYGAMIWSFKSNMPPPGAPPAPAPVAPAPGGAPVKPAPQDNLPLEKDDLKQDDGKK